MFCIERFFPQWRNLSIRESSPVLGRGANRRLSKEAPAYVASHYYAGVAPGKIVNGIRCENLERLSFGDEPFDLHITQDVFEHLFDPAAAFCEIARTLKPGGAHVFTTPLVIMEGDASSPPSREGFGPGRFYDIAGFVEQGRWARFTPPFFDQLGPVFELDSVGCCYLVNADLYRHGARHQLDQASATFIAENRVWEENAILPVGLTLISAAILLKPRTTRLSRYICQAWICISIVLAVWSLHSEPAKLRWGRALHDLYERLLSLLKVAPVFPADAELSRIIVRADRTELT
jgi:SAM-dependent methyltransferase